MPYTTIKIDLDVRGVATLYLARPEKHNALSAEMIAEMTMAARELSLNRDIRVVVLAAQGKSFCAGGDLGWMKEQMSADRAQRIREARKLAEMLHAWNEMGKPVIGRVHGNAFGGGVGMISVCDIAFCSKNAKFGLTETRLGLIPATISPYVVAKMGEGKAREVAMSARIFDAERACALNLVAQVVDDLDVAIEAEIEAYLATAPEAVAATKALLRSLGPRIDEDVIAATIERLADTWEGAEASEGIDAFFNKRKADWIR